MHICSNIILIKLTPFYHVSTCHNSKERLCWNLLLLTAYTSLIKGFMETQDVARNIGDVYVTLKTYTKGWAEEKQSS